MFFIMTCILDATSQSSSAMRSILLRRKRATLNHPAHFPNLLFHFFFVHILRECDVSCDVLSLAGFVLRMFYTC